MPETGCRSIEPGDPDSAPSFRESFHPAGLRTAASVKTNSLRNRRVTLRRCSEVDSESHAVD